MPHVDTAHRKIVTELPHPEDVKVINKIKRLESSVQDKELPVVWDRAEGFQIHDRWGNTWIDLSSTIFVTNSGHSNPRAVKRLQKVVDKGILHTYCYPTYERAEFLEKLIQCTPDYLEKATLVSTGTEASERALKLARLYGMQFEPRKRVIVGGVGNFHGKTMGAMMAATSPAAREWIGNQDPDMHQIPFPYPWVLEKTKLTGAEVFSRDLASLEDKGVKLNQIAAFIIESYQGWGAIFYPEDYIQAMYSWTRENNSLFIVDEIQAGFGRTGKIFGYQYYNVEPDIVCCGKGISGALPLSAVLASAELIELDPTLTSTHGGHVAACAAATGNLESLFDDGLIEHAAQLGKKLHQRLLQWQNMFPDRIPRILGRGLVWAIFICKPGTDELDPTFTDKLVEEALYRGVFSIRTGCGTIKLGPPLCITQDALFESIDIYERCMSDLIG